MKKLHFLEVEGNTKGFYTFLGLFGLISVIGMLAAYYMEHNGHWVTGMSNQIIWGTPHVFAIFLIVAASGALNVASISSVFAKTAYKPLARLSGMLALALLSGGLVVLLLDLGRPDRLIVAMTKFNFVSIFTWNIFLYTGFMGIVGIYLWTMMDRPYNNLTKKAGMAAFIWRLVLTTGTGSIFGFLIAREAYDSALLAPMFIIMSFSFGLAFFLLVLMGSYKYTDRELGDYIVNRLKNLLGVFVAAVFYFVIVYHIANLYSADHRGITTFILADGGIYTFLFWVVQIVLGSLLPLGLLYGPTGNNRTMIGLASVLVIIGGMAQLYVIIIGGQAYPMHLFPGMEVSSSFYDGVVASYSPSLPEVLLGLGGFGVTLLLVTVAVAALKFLPASLADAVADPHSK
ncbi:MAG: polysulfide reductase NrfD [gamma proteobacterium symbiont of Bathyaustriella thionipta]|nr:polysulfide reductase NrfD [gamma proteobacterium symbiont of Bathyaustriella thionipta]MCU7948517.1 polysulfide reductase NrfD [gamma proteobacterium symbiont of Bathyaustriella thionipta]MCU7953824.1 polysulfide reductase NrfD [gamma proteobacterium symbiont of Bathyaustriella thionipta]MCU7955066.1 polysulfide reductase NrfD [gamma proteobacterium symbiont of Bathyaustriella thionipta]MCU7967605.1 polysulfide reductase NrfD [gamma proteobacterium symbiont of Bathyaustriella thionipta]